jgi:hypothetical protein
VTDALSSLVSLVFPPRMGPGFPKMEEVRSGVEYATVEDARVWKKPGECGRGVFERREGAVGENSFAGSLGGRRDAESEAPGDRRAGRAAGGVDGPETLALAEGGGPSFETPKKGGKWDH